MTEEEQLVVQYFEYINDNANVNPNDEITYPPVALSCGSFDLTTNEGKENISNTDWNIWQYLFYSSTTENNENVFFEFIGICIF